MNARRLWITGRHEVDLAPFEVSEALAPDQVLIETERTLVSAGTELAIVMGTHIGFTTGARWPRYPMALGYTAVGRVAAVGDAVDRCRVGDCVSRPPPTRRTPSPRRARSSRSRRAAHPMQLCSPTWRRSR
jgi:NADPH:quinone reductase-like Zn-dependent oxidoreductase